LRLRDLLWPKQTWGWWKKTVTWRIYWRERSKIHMRREKKKTRK
jgi:hypothetical protein